MPYLNIVTNQTVPDEATLLKAVSQTVAKAAGKPENYVMVSIEAKANIIMGGSDDPTAFSDVLCSLITEHLGISGPRIYISMADAERQNWGWNHSTF